uniref:(6-4)DNA photolyase n=2 Tax=Nicotiana TaxID=4085 RepID=A0A1S3Y7F6_TOBAC|nr:PREDICTED: (6-4)DNA photolyase-like [Nicotiana tabacum]
MKPATTVLSPYLKFGCLSSRYFYQCIQDIQKSVKKHTSPPVSLLGQLLWRDFFYTVSFGTPNFDQMKGNRICKQIPWKNDDELLAAWRDARTGFPWIDAIMTQLRKWGWMHHLARHSVACFLTRGDLFVHWEKGRDVFDRLLIDSDWAINNGNWLWLSCSSFFYQYHRIYSPTSFGKKYDPAGNYIRHFLPVLKDMPKEYIYEPWTAPLSVQRKARCIIGLDYPKPVVSHDSASKECRMRLGEAYELNKKLNGLVSEEHLNKLRRKNDDESTILDSISRRKKQKLIG